MTPLRITPAAAVLGLCIAIGPSIAGFFIYKGILEAKMSDRFVTVKGLVERVEKADRGMWDIRFKVSGNDLSALYQKMSKDSNVIKEFVTKAGFHADEISVSAPRVTDLHAREYSSGQLSPERYLIESSVYVNSKNVDVLNTLSSKTAELLNEGVSISSTNTIFYLDKFNDLRPQLIADATKNAEEVAESFAKNTGSDIGGIRRANQGVITLTSPDASPNQSYDDGASSLLKKIRVVSTIEFYLK